MISVIQRVISASIEVENKLIAKIGAGLVSLTALEKDDDIDIVESHIQRLIQYRVFPDDTNKMNRSLSDIRAELLLVPQFTLPANTAKGLRPSFDQCAHPQKARQLFESAIKTAQSLGIRVQSGAFGKHMRVQLINDGPVTFIFNNQQ